MRLQILALGIALVASGTVLAGCTIEDPYTGEPFAQNRKIETRRGRPTKEELDRAPQPPYDEVLRAEQAQKDRLEIPKDIHERTQFLAETDRTTRAAMGPGFGPAHDPWMSYEEDRRRVLVHEWADTGTPEAPPVEVKPERVTEDDPYAPAPKVGKKEAPAEGDAPAGDKKPPEGDEKKPEGDAEKKGE